MIEEFMAHNDAERHVYALQLGETTHLVSTDEAAAKQMRAAGIQIARTDDQTAMAPLLAVMHPQARGLMESGLARSFERLGRAAEMVTIMQAINNVPTGHRMDSVLHALDVDLAEPKAEYVASWDLASFEANVYHPPGPNEGRQAPPPRREWWSTQCKGKGTPGSGCQKQDKRARKAQKLARKANRSK
jgi:hypothetical protein